MADFVYDVITLNGAKVDRAPIPVGEDPNKWLDVSDWNPAISALNDIRDAIINNRFLGLQRLGVQPNVPTGGAPDFLWMTSGGVPTFHIGGVNYNFMLASTLTAGVLPVATGVDTIGNSSFIATGPTLDITATAGGVMTLGDANSTGIIIGKPSVNPFIQLGGPDTQVSIGDLSGNGTGIGGLLMRGSISISPVNDATALAPLQSSELLFFNPLYWDGAAQQQDPWAITAKMDSASPVQSSLRFSLNNITDLLIIRRTGALEFSNGSTAAVSPAGFGALRYNNTTHVFEQSLNGGAWTALVSGGTISGLTATHIPVATSPTAIADSNFTASGNTLDLAAAGTITLGGTAVGLNIASSITGVQVLGNTTLYPGTTNTGALGSPSNVWGGGYLTLVRTNSVDALTATTLNIGTGNANAIVLGHGGGAGGVFINMNAQAMSITDPTSYIYNLGTYYSAAQAATSLAPLQSTPTHVFRGFYWNGTASTSYDSPFYLTMDSTAPSAHFGMSFPTVGEMFQFNSAGVLKLTAPDTTTTSLYASSSQAVWTTGGLGLILSATAVSPYSDHSSSDNILTSGSAGARWSTTYTLAVDSGASALNLNAGNLVINFQAAGSTKMALANSGTTFQPGTNGGTGLGSGSFGWSNLYLSAAATIATSVAGATNTTAMTIAPNVADGATSKALVINSITALSTTGHRILSIENAGTEVFGFDGNSGFYAPSGTFYNQNVGSGDFNIYGLYATSGVPLQPSNQLSLVGTYWTTFANGYGINLKTVMTSAAGGGSGYLSIGFQGTEKFQLQPGGEFAALSSGIGTGISTIGISAQNTTAATAGAVQQNSPWIEMTGAAWNTTSLATNPIKFGLQTVPASGSSTTIGGQMNFGYSILGSSYVTIATLDGNGNFNASGGVQTQAYFAGGQRNASSTVTVTASDFIVGVSGSGARTVNLPAVSACKRGQIFIIQDVGNSAGTITINRAGTDLINGGTSVTIAAAYGALMIWNDGSSAWYAH